MVFLMGTFLRATSDFLSMRNYLFTEKERRILEAFVEDGTRLEGFRQLAHRLRAAWPRLLEDLTLVFRLGAERHPFLEEYVDRQERLREWLEETY